MLLSLRIVTPKRTNTPDLVICLILQCDSLAVIECGPGFPLTLRLENPIQEGLASVSTFGHPVVDTTGTIGYICDHEQGSIGHQVPQVMCRMMGYTFGRKLQNIGFNTNDKGKYIHVFDQIQCKGDEESLFDCSLGPWLLG